MAGPERVPERLRQRLRADYSARKRDPRRVGSRGPERGTRGSSPPLSRVATEVCGTTGDYGQDDGLLTARIGDVVVSSVYAPFGNPAVRGKDGALAHKVGWLDRLIAHLQERGVGSDRSVLCGDFNVLPDVPAKPGVPNCTPEEQQRLRAILGTGFVDLYRCVTPLPDQGLNYGFNPRLPPTARLQLILAGERVAASASDVWVDEEYRAVIDGLGNRTWPASAPVITDLGDPL